MIYQGFEEDREFILSSAQDLDQYLTSEVLLWRMEKQDMPLTPGNLLLAIKRINGFTDAPVENVILSINSLREKRRSAWEKKITKEYSLRLNQWKNQVEEIVQQGSIDASYRHNVRVRVILALISVELRFDLLENEKTVNTMDSQLMALTQPDGFVWDSVLEKSFPQDEFPFLYLKENE